MNKQQYEANKSILLDAVDTATHVDNEGDYWSMGNDDEPSFFNSIDEVWYYCETEAPLRKLSDIKTLCTQYERIVELEKDKAYLLTQRFLGNTIISTDQGLLDVIKANNLEQQQLAVTRFANKYCGECTSDYQVRLSGEASLYVEYLEELKEQG